MFRWGLDPTQTGSLLRGIMSGFSHMPLSTIPSGRDVGTSPHDIAIFVLKRHVKLQLTN